MELIILFLIAIYIGIKTNFANNITRILEKKIKQEVFIISFLGVLVWLYLGERFIYGLFQNWHILKTNMEFSIIYPLFIQLNNLFLKLFESGSENATRVAMLSDDYVNYLLSFLLLYFSIWYLNRGK